MASLLPDVPPNKPALQSWIQTGVAIATGCLILMLGIVMAFGLLAGREVTAFTIYLGIVMPLASATAGGYLTSLLAPAKPVQHGFGLLGLTILLWLSSSSLSLGDLAGLLELVLFATSLIGIGTGTWLGHRAPAKP